MSAETARQGIDYRRPMKRRPIDAGIFTRSENDFYVEPEWAVKGLLDVQRFSGVGWDPAAGSGTIPRVLAAAGLLIEASDINPRRVEFRQLDFLDADPKLIVPPIDFIVCNPPYAHASKFIRIALSIARHKVAMLLRLSFLEAGEVDRDRGWALDEAPLAAVHPFKHRVSMPPGDSETEAKGGRIAFAWFIWSHDHTGPAIVKRISRGPK